MSAVPSQPSALTPIPDHTFCPQCAYDLTASTSEKCSECGYNLDGLRPKESAIPWTHRKAQGYLRTYTKTVWLILFNHKQFCEEIVRPVNYRDARKFQLITILLAFLPALTTITAAYLWYPPQDDDLKGQASSYFMTTRIPTVLDLAYNEVWPLILCITCFLLCLLATTSVPSYFFHPREIPIRQQNRAIALSYYIAAPLALINFAFIAEILFLYFFWPDKWIRPQTIMRPNYFNASIGLQIFGPVALACLISWIAYYHLLQKTHNRIMPHTRKHRIALSALLPITWLLLAFLCLVCIPFGIMYMLVAIFSLM